MTGKVANGIWKAQPLEREHETVFDALVYELPTAGGFGWRWPSSRELDQLSVSDSRELTIEVIWRFGLRQAESC